MNGNSVYLEMYGTSSYEKDGSVHTFSMGETSSRIDISAEQNFEMFTPVNNQTLSGTVMAGPILATFEWIFLDSEYNTLAINAHMYDRSGGHGAEAVHSFRTFLTRVTEEKWLKEMSKTYEACNVLKADRPQEGPLLDDLACLSDVCPTEEDWCRMDPKCSTSPYQEPEGTIRAGIIASFLMAVFIVIFALLYLLHLKLLAEQAARNRKAFVRRVAGSIRVSVNSRMLTPDALASRFHDIDSGKNAHEADSYISKEELWDFMSSGQAGEMSRSDFESLFEAMDEDGNGHVDFLEFCTFLGGCSEELEEVNLNRGQKLQLAARRVSSSATVMPQGGLLPASILEELDEEEGNSGEGTPLMKK